MATTADTPSEPLSPSPEAINRVYDTMSEIFKIRTASRCCGYFLSRIKPTYTILDVGCGPGSITLDLARLVPLGRVVAFDISSDFIQQARDLAQEQGVTNVDFFQADIIDPRFHTILQEQQRHQAHPSFDVIHAHMVLMHVSDPVRALRAMHHCLEPGGILACRDSITQITYPESPIQAKIYAYYQQSSRRRGGHPDAGKMSHVWAHQAGFAWDRIECSSGSWEYSSSRHRRIWADGVGVFQGGGLATPEEVQEHVRSYDEWARREDARMFSLDGQIVCTK